MKSYKLLLGLAVTASAPSALAAQPAPVLDINQPVAASQSVATNNVANDDVEALKRAIQTRNRALNDMQLQIDDLQNEVSQLRGLTEEQAYTINQILQRQRELYQELDRVASMKSGPSQPVASNTNTGVNYSANLSENESYDRAVNLVLKEKKYDQAIEEFKAFTRKYPNSSYAANAHYWLGQLLFNKGQLKEAEAEFTIVIDNHQDSNKRSDAMLKQGMVAQKQNNLDKARQMYRRVISEYANSSAAQLAQTRLNSISN
ncbi:tol-pal system protein YbgF [Thalassotalea mangrovi]|uniref:Cell division coordinator CpoB n=1 Tax=Thalassotalea mangrovi TaxID=2572245 RepID=A0A4U1B633_9GAMM|nr:tol-pal system protein YbgF [Thalassotalea mangrovi]TKB45793.1 tol-pal system protein YbgF [Thalassotalea mangrovi]